MIRLFIAITIPDHIKLYLRGMGKSIPQAKEVVDSQLHLTMKFIGEVEGSLVLDIEERLADVNFSSFSIGLKGVGIFPPRGNPRVVWAGVQEEGELTNLRNDIERILAEIGIPRGKKKFTPHITLARLKKGSRSNLQNFLMDNSLFATPSFTVTEFALYSSNLTSKGATHTCRRIYCPVDRPT